MPLERGVARGARYRFTGFRQSASAFQVAGAYATRPLKSGEPERRVLRRRAASALSPAPNAGNLWGSGGYL